LEQSKIWEFFQNDSNGVAIAFQDNARYQYIASKITDGMNILNIGVGRGGLEKILVSKNIKIYSLDPSENSINFIKDEFNLGDNAKVGFSQEIPFKNDQFDIVIMSEVLEHLSNEVLLETIKECHRVLRSGGRFIGTVPADEALNSSLVVCPGCDNKFHRWGHVQSFSKTRLDDILNTKFSKVIIKREFFGNWTSLNWKGRMLFLVKKITVLMGFNGSGENYFFSAIK
tara:strand:- start:291 stop:974 length:684 start_codon:yes stop_codon:yes gene_type:complete